MNTLEITVKDLPIYFTVPYLAETSSYYYGQDNYNSVTYNGQKVPTPVNNSVDKLVNSGTATASSVILGSLLIFFAILTRVAKRDKKGKNQ